MPPPLVGPAFSANYDGQSVGDLFDRNRTTMPVGKEGHLMLKSIKYLAEKPGAKP